MNRFHKLILPSPTLLVLAFFAFHTALAQNTLVTGKLTEAATETPLGYASVRVLQSVDNKLVNGALTNEKGEFTVTLPPGQLWRK